MLWTALHEAAGTKLVGILIHPSVVFDSKFHAPHPPQGIEYPWQEQVEPLHVWLVSQQLPPQAVLLASQQMPDEQTRVPQEWPQVPQLLLLLLRSIHVPPQHDCPAIHECPQAPQFDELVLRSVHVPEHEVFPVPQQVSLEQLPFVHCPLLVQGLPSVTFATHWLVLQY
jgi:hypothetical protein